MSRCKRKAHKIIVRKKRDIITRNKEEKKGNATWLREKQP